MQVRNGELPSIGGGGANRNSMQVRNGELPSIGGGGGGGGLLHCQLFICISAICAC